VLQVGRAVFPCGRADGDEHDRRSRTALGSAVVKVSRPSAGCAGAAPRARLIDRHLAFGAGPDLASRPCPRRPRRCRSPQSTRPPRGRRTRPTDRDFMSLRHAPPRRRATDDICRSRANRVTRGRRLASRRYHTGCRCGFSWTTAPRCVPAPASVNICTSSCAPIRARTRPTTWRVHELVGRSRPARHGRPRARVVDRRVPVSVLNYSVAPQRVAARGMAGRRRRRGPRRALRCSFPSAAARS
jgi:hypothetical protein